MNTEPRILYVDDDADGCELMAFQLNHLYGIQIETVLDGATALALIRSCPFDVYLLDYCLPDVTAIKLCKEIKSIDPAAPIFIYSALDRDVDRKQALEAGASRYFVKPEQLVLIGPELKKILWSKGFDREMTSPESKTVHPDRRPLRRRAGGIL